MQQYAIAVHKYLALLIYAYFMNRRRIVGFAVLLTSVLIVRSLIEKWQNTFVRCQDYFMMCLKYDLDFTFNYTRVLLLVTTLTTLLLLKKGVNLRISLLIPTVYVLHAILVYLSLRPSFLYPMDNNQFFQNNIQNKNIISGPILAIGSIFFSHNTSSPSSSVGWIIGETLILISMFIICLIIISTFLSKNSRFNPKINYSENLILFPENSIKSVVLKKLKVAVLVLGTIILVFFFMNSLRSDSRIKPVEDPQVKNGHFEQVCKWIKNPNYLGPGSDVNENLNAPPAFIQSCNQVWISN